TVSSHGVRQVWPWVVLASAPGGSDSIRKVSVAGADLKKSRLGIDAEHAARVKPHATKAMTRLIVGPHQLGGRDGHLYPRMRPHERDRSLQNARVGILRDG